MFNDMNAWLVIYAFAFQIYGDFSGYSDIARGLSKIMGYELVVNFRAPYLVSNPADFWKNWHISLSEWLRDYLYIPLGGNRCSTTKAYRNLMTTMLLGGLWHGAGMAYILWGFYQGALLSINRWWGLVKNAGKPPSTTTDKAVPAHWIRRTVGVVVFFHIICIGWLLFIAGSLPKGVSQIHRVMEFLVAMFHPISPTQLHPLFWPVLVLGALCFLFQWKHKRMDEFAHWPLGQQIGSVTLALCAIASLGVFEGAQFIYFQF
jgi:D-alanyl-lipoteichoic acid acyltransferase DltB (MBOAT superfamily)